MNARDLQPDAFEVVNGPEDGTDFPVTRTPFDIGCDAGCGVMLRLDPEIKRYHARVTVVAEGYRIRRLANGPVWVDGRKVGIVRSRIVRSGGTVRVGGTDLCFVAAPEGLASRSYGMPTESDFGWALRLLLRKAGRFLPALLRFAQDSFGGTLKMIVPLAALLFVLNYFWPGILGEARDYAWRAYYFVRHYITVFIGF